MLKHEVIYTCCLTVILEEFAAIKTNALILTRFEITLPLDTDYKASVNFRI